MTVLSNRDVVERLGDTVIIDPFVPENVNTSSVDVTLGEWYYAEQRPSRWRRLLSLLGVHEVHNPWDQEHVTRMWGAPRQAQAFLGDRWSRYRGVGPGDRVIVLPPRANILAHTVEFIGGRRNVTTRMNARSSTGRNLITVCKCAGQGDVGFTNRWTMEIANNSYWRSVLLVVGRRVAQISFYETGPLADAGYDYTVRGKYQVTPDVDADHWDPAMMLPKMDLDRDVYRSR